MLMSGGVETEKGKGSEVIFAGRLVATAATESKHAKINTELATITNPA
jgi:hypothetical protein